MLDSLTKLAPFLTNPFVLLGLSILFFYKVHILLISSNILRSLTVSESSVVVKLILKYGFYIAILLIVFGFIIVTIDIYTINSMEHEANVIMLRSTSGEVKIIVDHGIKAEDYNKAIVRNRKLKEEVQAFSRFYEYCENFSSHKDDRLCSAPKLPNYIAMIEDFFYPRDTDSFITRIILFDKIVSNRKNIFSSLVFFSDKILRCEELENDIRICKDRELNNLTIWWEDNIGPNDSNSFWLNIVLSTRLLELSISTTIEMIKSLMSIDATLYNSMIPSIVELLSSGPDGIPPV